MFIDDLGVGGKVRTSPGIVEGRFVNVVQGGPEGRKSKRGELCVKYNDGFNRKVSLLNMV